jgi:hypothetical protein
MSKIKFGAFAQQGRDNSTFVCGTIFKLNDDKSVLSGALFLAKIDGNSMKQLNFLYSWGSDYPNDYDECKSMKYDEST